MVIASDPAKLSLILRNLLENACAYSPDHSQIEVSYRESKEGTSLLFSNVTTELNQQDLSKMSDSFWRKESARSDSAHVGLGLSIAHTVAHLLQLEVNMHLAPDNVFTVSLGLVKMNE